MKLKDTIEHEGIIKQISGNTIKVEIIKTSACNTCEAKKQCCVTENSTKIIDIITTDSNFSLNDKVNVYLPRHLAVKALFLAYIIPFFCIIITLLSVNFLTKNEIKAGLASIGILIPYFIILKIFNKRIQIKYNFKIAKFDH